LKRAAIVREGPRAPRDVWRVDLSGAAPSLKFKQVTYAQLNPREFALGEQEIVRWKSRDGWTIHGVLIKPHGYKKEKRYPTIVCVHGGPTSMVGNGFMVNSVAGNSIWGQALASQGYAVFFPNFRGSAGFGLKFAESNVGDMGGADYHDIDSGVDALIERGIADPKRLGLGGWSYGGFMTCWTVTQTTRYKAAVMGAGISNWLSFHGNTEIHTWDAFHYKASPYERDGVYAKFSGMNFVDRVKTPTLILHGEADRCVPAEQAFQFYRALRDHKVPAELVIYPREGHGISEKLHWLDLRRRVLAWYDKHL
jgi:dipeptidyl aminopeptidase/acylaminoacyl peptidase